MWKTVTINEWDTYNPSVLLASEPEKWDWIKQASQLGRKPHHQFKKLWFLFSKLKIDIKWGKGCVYRAENDECLDEASCCVRVDVVMSRQNFVFWPIRLQCTHKTAWRKNTERETLIYIQKEVSKKKCNVTTFHFSCCVYRLYRAAHTRQSYSRAIVYYTLETTSTWMSTSTAAAWITFCPSKMEAEQKNLSLISYSSFLLTHSPSTWKL